MIVACGNPCGPCFSYKRFMYLRTACSIIAILEFFTGCAFFAGSMGSWSALHRNRNQLHREHDSSVYTEKEMNRLYAAFVCQGIFGFAFMILGLVCLIGYLYRDKVSLITYVVGAIIFHITSFVYACVLSFFLFPAYDFILLLTPLRVYYFWIIYCFWLEVMMYPEGFPPPPKPKVIESTDDIMGPNVSEASTLRILGDG